MNKYLPWGVIFLVSLIGFIWAVADCSLIAIIVFGVVGYFTGKKTYDIYKASKATPV